MFYDNFLKACNSIGKTPSAALAEIGINKSAATRWRKGEMPTVANVHKIADYFGISPEELTGSTGPAQKKGSINHSIGLPKGAVLIDHDAFHTIPILGRISAGLPLYAEQHIEGYTVTDLNGGAEYFALRVHGDSMDALGIRDGYTIIVRIQDEVDNGQVAVVMVGDEDATVKRFYAHGSTVTLMPQSTNPSHQPQIYDTAKTSIKIIGRVVEVKFTL